MIAKLLAALVVMFLLDYRLTVLERPYRCDGDLIKAKTINGHKVELFHWIK